MTCLPHCQDGVRNWAAVMGTGMGIGQLLQGQRQGQVLRVWLGDGTDIVGTVWDGDCPHSAL